MIKDLSASLIAAAAEINKKSREAFHAEQAAMEAKKKPKMPMQPTPKAEPAAVTGAGAKMAEEVGGTVPKTPKEKKLAALAGNKKLITHADVMTGRGVKKEEVEAVEEAFSPIPGVKINHPKHGEGKILGYTRPGLYKVRYKSGVEANHSERELEKHHDPESFKSAIQKEEAETQQEGWDDMMKASKEGKGTGKFDKKEIKPGVTQYTRKSSTFDDGPGKDSDERKIDREKRKGMSEGLMATLKKIGKKAVDTIGHGSDEDLRKDLQKKMGLPQTGKKPVKENMDTPGNSTHQCAIHVKSEQFGEGRCLTGQHAEPDAQGLIEWYDVMFAEGIQRVNTKDVEVLVSENHMNHTPKKKKAK